MASGGELDPGEINPTEPAVRVLVRPSPADPSRYFFDFDPAAPGGRGGASIRLDLARGLASIDGVHRNTKLPLRSTGELLADGLRQIGGTKLLALEAFNVERTTAAALAAGSPGHDTRIGHMLEDTVRALGGTIARWGPIDEGTAWNLLVHIAGSPPGGES